MPKQTNNNDDNLGFEAQLWATADKLRGNMVGRAWVGMAIST